MNRVLRLIFLELLVPWEKKLNFLRFWDLTYKDTLIMKFQKIKLYSVRVLKRYHNKKNLIHCREIAAISKFSALNIETY